MRARKLMVWAFVAIVIFGLAPIISLVIAGGIASAAGCQLDESGVHPCVLLGLDFGGLLSGMGVAGWLVFMTAPLAAVAFGIWAIAALVLYFRARRTG